MTLKVARVKNTYRLRGRWCDLDAANRFLAQLAARALSPATIRAYAFDLLNFARSASSEISASTMPFPPTSSNGGVAGRRATTHRRQRREAHTACRCGTRDR